MIPTRIIGRHLHVDPTTETLIHDHVARLEDVHPRLVRCEVRLDAPHGHELDVGACVDVRVPGREIVAHARGEEKADALRAAFETARRQLHHFVHRRQTQRMAGAHK